MNPRYFVVCLSLLCSICNSQELDQKAQIDALESKLASKEAQVIRDEVHIKLADLEKQFLKRRNEIYSEYRDDLKEVLRQAIQQDNSKEMKTVVDLIALLASGAPAAFEQNMLDEIKRQLSECQSQQRVVAVWLHSYEVAGGGSGIHVYLSNGEIVCGARSKRNFPRWKLDGRKLEMDWPGIRDFNRCELSERFDKYQGTNRHGDAVWGELVWSAKSWPN